jgi:hypothetical protein
MRKVSERPLLTLIQAGGVNDMPVVVPTAATSDALVEALKTVKKAGYRVSKPRKPETFKRGKNRVGPTCVAEFSDGEVTRMSVSCTPKKLDWNRGERLSQAAWESRWQTHKRAEGLVTRWAPTPPPIVAMHFEEQDGTVLARRPDDGGVS